MGGKKVTNNTTTSTQTAAPPAYALPGIEELARRVTSIIPNVPGEKYMGDFVAGPNATQMGSLPLYQNASNSALALGQLAQGASQNVLNMPQITPQFGEWQTQAYDTAPAIAAATAPIMRQLTREILPGLNSSAIQSGAYGNNRAMELLPALAIGETIRNAQEIGAGINYNDFARQQVERMQGYGLMTERGLGGAQVDLQNNAHTLQAMNLLPSLLDTTMRMNTGAADILSQSGSMQQQWDQSAIDNQLARFNYNINYPFQGLDTATQLLGALAGNYGTTTGSGTSRTVESSGGLAPVLGGLMGLGSMVAGFPGAGNMLGSLFKRTPTFPNVMGM